MAVLGGWAVSYERGTLVTVSDPLFWVAGWGVGVRSTPKGPLQGLIAHAGAVCLFWIETNLATMYRGASLRRNRGRLGPYSRTMSRALWQS